MARKSGGQTLSAGPPPGPPSSKTESLLPCPFCGGTSAHLEYEAQKPRDGFIEGAAWCVVCDVNLGGCGASGGYRDEAPEAVVAWTRRSAPETTAEQNFATNHRPTSPRYCPCPHFTEGGLAKEAYFAALQAHPGCQVCRAEKAEQVKTGAPPDRHHGGTTVEEREGQT